MKMQMTVDKLFTLRRLHSKLGEIITWEVLNYSKNVRLGIIRQRNDDYLVKRLGWREVKIKYWIGSRFLAPTILVAPTQKDLLRLMFRYMYDRQEKEKANA